MANLPPLELLLEMARSQSAIAALTGRPPTALSYPNGSSNERVRKIAGWFYTYGVRTYAGVYVTGRDPLLIERITVSRGTPLEAFKAACQTADVSEYHEHASRQHADFGRNVVCAEGGQCTG